jgi:hypothetical protein
MSRRLFKIAVVVAFVLLLWQPTLAPRHTSKPGLPQAQNVKPPGRPPIEEAFKKIYPGMPDDELFALMAPYENARTGHHQWQVWVEGDSEVYVTIWPDPNVLAHGQWCVQDSHLKSEVFDAKIGANVAKWTPDDRIIARVPKKR